MSRLSDFEKLATLGRGSFGVVFKVRRRVDGNLYVLKQINIANLEAKEQQDAINEVQIMASLDSPYVVRYYDSFLDDGCLNIIMEYCQKGDLCRRLKDQAGRLLTEDEVWRFFIQIALGLAHIHSKHILHRDLKSMNLFIDDKNRIKIGDLGVARVLGHSTYAHTVVGTPYYLSPELCENKPYNDRSDVWALGCVLYELASLKHPFDANNQGALILKILRGKYPPLPGKYSARLKRLLEACLRKESSRRPSLTQILASSAVYSKAKELGMEMPPEVEALRASLGANSSNGNGRASSATSSIGLDSERKKRRPGPLSPAVSSAALPLDDGKAEKRTNSPVRSPPIGGAAGRGVPVTRGGKVAPSKAAAAGGRGGIGRNQSASHARVLSSGGLPKPPIPLQHHGHGGHGGAHSHAPPTVGAAPLPSVPAKRPGSERPRAQAAAIAASNAAAAGVVAAAAKRNAVAKPLGHPHAHVSQIKVEPKFLAGFDHLPSGSLTSSLSTSDLPAPATRVSYASSSSYSPASMASHFQSAVAMDAPRAIVGKPGVSQLTALTRTADFDHTLYGASATIASAPSLGASSNGNGSMRVSSSMGSLGTSASVTAANGRRLASLASSLADTQRSDHDGDADGDGDDGHYYDDEFDDDNAHGDTQYLGASNGPRDGAVTWRVKDDLEGSYEDDDDYANTARTREKLVDALAASAAGMVINHGHTPLPTATIVHHGGTSAPSSGVAHGGSYARSSTSSAASSSSSHHRGGHTDNDDDDDNVQYHSYSDGHGDHDDVLEVLDDGDGHHDDDHHHIPDNEDDDDDDNDVTAVSTDELSAADHEWLQSRIDQLQTTIASTRAAALATSGMTPTKMTALFDYYRAQAEADDDTSVTTAPPPFTTTSEVRGLIFRLLSLESELAQCIELTSLPSSRAHTH